ncbi:uncharacterized protein BX663DRAFT_502839 [Cokeromyces recurvatus]|uniref:uncharacterized protein n=1 Tax=Cokeromyces recurvatus TaxID=90255 RepID=UPI00221F698C|nr:uncharacterized protein BX663DRAFT_502839 [Cokeromyces recurvatus]KAI7904574.1 hypothetical protein BX663DRAFT_502839 [Cokeromyces recurvatus]
MNNHLFLNDNNSIIDSISPNPPENTVQQPLLKQTQFSQDNTESTTTNPPHQYRPIFHKFQSDSSTQVLFPVANPKHENQNLINKAAQVAIKVAAEAAAAAAAAAAATTTTSKTEIIANNESTPTSLNTNHHSLTKGKITGENVTAENIEEGYIQFVTRHDPNYISDDIESLVYAKRKFNSVPKTGDLCYTTWDVYQLVLKLHQKEVYKYI